MERPWLVRAFLDELPLKIVSLVIAITLFVIVRSERDAATGVTVKVVYALPVDRVLVSDPVSEVRIAVRGPWTRLSRLDEHALDPVRIDLQDAKDGVLHFEDSMFKLPAGLRVASITPPDVLLRFEPKRTRELPIEPVLEGQPADGFRVVTAVPSPTTIKVEGAESALVRWTRARTRPVAITGARESRTAEAMLEPEPPHARYAGPSTVSVRVDVQPVIVERRLEDVSIRAVGLSRYDATVDPPAATVILRGPGEAVGAIRPDQVGLTIDGALAELRAPGRSERRVAVTGLPAGVAAEVRPENVILTTHRRHE